MSGENAEKQRSETNVAKNEGGCSAAHTRRKKGQSRLSGLARCLRSCLVPVCFVFRPMLPPRCRRALFVPVLVILLFCVWGHLFLSFPIVATLAPLHGR